MFTFTPLNGARSSSGASQSLLELDGGIKILVDVGWDETFAPGLLAEIEKHTPTLSFIILTHATLSHLGAFVHCQKFIPNFNQVPVFATLPVITFGATLLKELYRSKQYEIDEERKKLQDEVAPSMEEIDRYFSLITPLKYSQPHQPKASFFSAPLDDLMITAYNSGHTLGGAIWHIQHEMESVVYAVDWNIVRENIIPAAAWFGGVGGSEVIEALRNPTALVCSSRGATQVASASGRKARDDIMLDHISSSVAKGGSVLIPGVPLARVLELAWMIDKGCEEAANDSPLRRAGIYLASKSGHAILRNARSLSDWVNESIVKGVEDDSKDSSRIFDFKHVRLIEKSKSLDRVLLREGPKILITSDISLDWPGFSRQALLKMTDSPENVIILVEEVSSNPVHDALVQVYKERSDGVTLERVAGGSRQVEQVYGGGRVIKFAEKARMPLDAADTQSLQVSVARRQLENTLTSSTEGVLAHTEDALDEESSSSDESDEEHQGRALNVSSTVGGKRNKLILSDEELGVSILLRKKGVHDYDVRSRKGRNAIFPYTHSRRRGDEYGDYIRPEDFLRAEEKEAAQESSLAAKDEPTSKRKWDVMTQQSTLASSKHRTTLQGKKDSYPVKDGAHQSLESESSDEEQEDSETEAGMLSTSGQSLALNSRLAFVDFSGIHDQRSLQMLIPLIGSKRLILIRGQEADTLSLATDCKELLALNDESSTDSSAPVIFSPVDGQVVNASVDTDTWDVKLGTALFGKLNWAPVQGRNVATLTGEVRTEPRGVDVSLPDRSKRPKLMKEENETHLQGLESRGAIFSTVPVLDVLSTSSARLALSTDHPIHVGDVVLKELQRYMIQDGHKARFAGAGTLLIDDLVAVRKLGTGKIVVEGPPASAAIQGDKASRMDSFTHVKRKIYAGLPVVAAGG